MRRLFPFGIALAALLASSPADATDWPQYRADAARTSHTADELPKKLALHWVRKARHKPHRAWVGRMLSPSRMKFDWCHAPVVAEGALFFASSADHKVYALDAATGEERWSFFTGGPVRLAPAAWRARVFAVSDDGHLYCLDAADGTTRWKVRAGPADELVIGNGRVVSRWAARGGPAVREGTVYFAAGVWPLEGVYVYALDAESGRVIWCNDNTGALEIECPHMGAFARGGVASQGHLAVSADKVYVPTGRSVPGVFDRKTGRLLHYHLSRYGGKTPWGVGGGDVVAAGEVYFNGGFTFDSATGLRYHPIPRDDRWDPYLFKGHKYHGQFLDGPRRDVAVTSYGIVYFHGKTLHGGPVARKTYKANREARVLKYAPTLDTNPPPKGAIYHQETIDKAPFVKSLWSADVGVEPFSMIVAGGTAVLGAKDRIVAFDHTGGRSTWSADVEGAVYALAAAGGRLYAATDTGSIYCFGRPARGRAAADPRVIEPRAKVAPYPLEGPVARAAAQIVESTGITKGYCLDVGCGDGQLAYEIAKRTELTVIGIDTDPKNVATARRKLDEAGMYGVRVTVLQGDMATLAFPDYFANLIVSHASLSGRHVVLRAGAQRPHGGAVCIGWPGEMQERSRGALVGAGEWTHALGDSGNSLCSDDEIVKGPLGMLWYEDETMLTIDRHGKNPAPLYSHGVMVRAGLDSIKGVDAYNGTKLWEVPLPGLLRAYQGGTGVAAVAIGGMCCIEDGVVYVRKDDRCLALDLHTGEQLAKHTAPRRPDGRKGEWGYLAVERGILFGTLSNEQHVVRGQHGRGEERVQDPMERHFTESAVLFAMDARTGEVKWSHPAKDSIRNNSIAVGSGRVHFIDRPVAEIDRILKYIVKEKRRGREPLPVHPKGVLICRDAATGRELWRDSENVFGTTLALSKRHDLLVMCYNRVGRTIPSDTFGRDARCYHASTGERVWQIDDLGNRPILSDRIIYSHPNAYDLLTGKMRPLARDAPRASGSGQLTARSRSSGMADRTRPWSVKGKGCGCGTPLGSKWMLFTRSGALGYYDIAYDLGWMETYGGMRSGCWLNSLPVGGIVLVPDDTRACRCSYQNQASIALIGRGVRAPEILPQAGQHNYAYTNRHTRTELEFTGSLVVTISRPTPDVVVRYTVDGSYPTADSPPYARPITLAETTTVRASAFRAGRKVAVRDGVLFVKVEKLVPPGRAGAGRRRNRKKR